MARYLYVCPIGLAVDGCRQSLRSMTCDESRTTSSLLVASVASVPLSEQGTKRIGFGLITTWDGNTKFDLKGPIKLATRLGLTLERWILGISSSPAACGPI